MHIQTNRLIHHLTHFHRHAPATEPSVQRSSQKSPKAKTALLIIGFALAATVGFVGGRQFPGRQNWEFTFTKMEVPADLVTVYEMGEEGWQVAGSYRDRHGTQLFLLQRPYKPNRIFHPTIAEQ